MSVTLRGRQRGMPQLLLYGPKVRSTREQVRCAAVAKGVGMHIGLRVHHTAVPYDSVHRSGAQPTLEPIQEQRSTARVHPKPGLQGEACRGTKGYAALLVPLALPDMHKAVVQVDVAPVQRRPFAHTKPCAVEERDR